ncbi:alpha-amylase family glycosyl hydrolase [Sphingopyxis sp. RIFCSPHIGHO2_12_FULL_65_19]|uniref:alpha-amylase family glycosyl hydrolase n=1 Tax=Sphingopyxis sp. RIFCSPHIGHO2_12_FULL_65_19 TaxID=1802172 RepID=UPI0008C3ED4E|nr:alpha-amylase family glycosyl hydrolase [Sphingopyxis sp. RIFCSPHIGHO2_12_FULL_65_19]OHD09936.1 MAG: alpha-amylase [Sphingopyxis sp. RIFCSPHIGHO2_12_FULL_65_19]
MIRRFASLALLLASLPAQADEAAVRARPATDEVIYFVLPDRFENGDRSNDRGGLKGDRLVTGHDPAAKGFYHGGDLAGLTKRLDYIQGMGATAIWFAPVFQNKPVQGPKGDESAGYHGYWVTDFTRVDPHFGSNAEFKAFVDAAHARGMKVYMDIITNHTADVIRYKEGAAEAFPYRALADYPFSRRGGVGGAPINPGFAGDQVADTANWQKLTNPAFAYTPVVPAGEENAKTPAWLNDPIYYHNRGNSNWVGESALYGDFAGLDDLATEHPRVVAGFIDIYGRWIDDFGIDGFRIDTAKHVNPEFWQAFVPAMQARAKARGIPNFHIFGEVYVDAVDPGALAWYTHAAGLPAVLDFGFARAAIDAVSGTKGTDQFARLFDGDLLYKGGAAAALGLPTFLGNHDMGRFAMFVKQANPDASEAELLARVMLGHSMLLTLRGVPTIYYGDEQGFVSDGNDQLAREDMFASQVALYNDNDLIGTDATTATANFDPAHPLYRHIAALTDIRRKTPALTRGATKVRAFSEKPGLLAVSRFDPDTGRELVLAFNSSAAPLSAHIAIDMKSAGFTALHGDCPARPAAPGSLHLSLPAFGTAICQASE